MALVDDFKNASEEVKKLKQKPKDKDLLVLYSFFKQATEGDANGKRPGMLNIVARKKFDSWAENKGLSKDDAMTKYVGEVERLKQQIGF